MALTKVTGQVINTSTDVTVGVLTVTNTLAVGGTVSIGGTLTYEDVTNIDSVGLITARNGIVVGSGITLSKDGDVFFTGIATGNGSGLTALNASNIGSGTVPTARLGSGTASSSTFLRGDSTFQTVNTDLVSDTSPQLGGDLDTNGNNINFGDSGSSSDDRLVLGSDSDFEIYHTGSGAYIQNKTGSLFIGCNFDDDDGGDIRIQPKYGENSIVAYDDGPVELYYDNARVFETDSASVKIRDNIKAKFGTGDDLEIYYDGTDGFINQKNNALKFNYNGTTKFFFGASYLSFQDDYKIGLGNSQDLEIFHNGTNAQVDNSTGNLEIRNKGTFSGTRNIYIRAKVDESSITCKSDGAVELYHDNSKKLETTSGGVTITGTLETTSGGINAGGNISLTDSVKLKCGTNDDLQIDHSGTNSQIYHDGTGHLYIGTAGSGEILYLFANQDVRIQTAGNEDAIRCNKDAAVYLYYDNALKFFTTADGIQVKNENLLRFKKETSTSGEVTAIQFEKDNPTNIVGRIRYDNGQTHYNTTSDYRLKENNVAITDGITRISQLKPYRFNFKVDPSKTVDGFFAHEVSSVVPEAITGEKDAVRDVLYNAQDLEDGTLPDGKSVGDVKESGVIDAQEIDQAKLVPLLVAAVQELIAEVEKLKSS